jgi:EmrB/QacA subfamily drug resistance transporter
MSEISTLSTGRTDRRRWIALIVVCLAMLMSALDSSIVNVALPSIQKDLHFTQSSLTWVVDAYLIAFGSFLLLAGRLGDLIGRKKVFLSGVAIFTLSSLVCAASQSQAELIIARFCQGLGGAVSSSVIVAIIITEFTGAKERAKAMSSFMFVTVSGGSIGLLVGGFLTQTVNWHWIFVINIPIGIVTLILGYFLIEENVGLGVRDGVDVAGSLLMTTSLVLGIFAIVKASSYGWGSLHTLGLLSVSIVLMAAFVVVESRVKRPIVPLRILKIRSLTASSAVRGLAFSAMFSVFFFGAIYLEKVLHYSPLTTGFAFLPMTVAMAIMSLGVTSRLLLRYGPMRLLIPGMTSVIVALLLLSHTGVHTDYVVSILPAFLLIGIGMSVSAVPLLTIAMTDVPLADAGLASGFVNVSVWLASSAALAVFGTLATSRTHAVAALGAGVNASLVAGYHVTFLVGAVLGIAGLVVTIFVLRAPAKEVVDARTNGTFTEEDERRLEIAAAES